MKKQRRLITGSGLGFAVLAVACASAPFVRGRSSVERSTAATVSSTAIINAKVYTDASDGADAVLVVGSKIVSIGKSSEIQSQCSKPCNVVDAKGGFLMPGFHDAHIHLIDAAKATFDFQTNLTSPSQLTDASHAFQKSLKTYIDTHPNNQWTYGGNWLVPGFKDNLPTKGVLDAVESNKPIALRDYGGHELWVNSKALALAGITHDTPDPKGGTIVRDSSGDPTGVLLESATYAVRAAIPLPTAAEYEEYILKGQEMTLAMGLTSTQGAEVPLTITEAQTYADMDRRGILKQRSFLWGNLLAKSQDFIDQVNFAKALPADGKVKIVAFKGFVDGTMTSSTAAMIQPYTDQPLSRGLLKLSQAQLNFYVLRANRAGFPAALHAMGDQAVRMTLNAFEYSENILGKKLPNRVEHATVVDLSDLARFKALGAIASIQPNFMFYKSQATFPFYKTLGNERIKRLYAWKNLFDAGAFLMFGSDHPDGGSSNADPITGIYCATQRLFQDGTPFSLDQALDPDVALKAYTANPAIAIGLGNSLGKIAIGYSADLVVLDQDPRTSNAKSTKENTVHFKMVDGIIF